MDLLRWNLAETVQQEVQGTDSKVLAGTTLSLPFYTSYHTRPLFLSF